MQKKDLSRNRPGRVLEAAPLSTLNAPALMPPSKQKSSCEGMGLAAQKKESQLLVIWHPRLPNTDHLSIALRSDMTYNTYSQVKQNTWQLDLSSILVEK